MRLIVVTVMCSLMVCGGTVLAEPWPHQEKRKSVKEYEELVPRLREQAAAKARSEKLYADWREQLDRIAVPVKLDARNTVTVRLAGKTWGPYEGHLRKITKRRVEFVDRDFTERDVDRVDWQRLQFALDPEARTKYLAAQNRDYAERLNKFEDNLFKGGLREAGFPPEVVGLPVVDGYYRCPADFGSGMIALEIEVIPAATMHGKGKVTVPVPGKEPVAREFVYDVPVAAQIRFILRAQEGLPFSVLVMFGNRVVGAQVKCRQPGMVEDALWKRVEWSVRWADVVVKPEEFTAAALAKALAGSVSLRLAKAGSAVWQLQPTPPKTEPMRTINVTCPECQGKKKIASLPAGEMNQPAEMACPTCAGTGSCALSGIRAETGFVMPRESLGTYTAADARAFVGGVAATGALTAAFVQDLEAQAKVGAANRETVRAAAAVGAKGEADEILNEEEKEAVDTALSARYEWCPLQEMMKSLPPEEYLLGIGAGKWWPARGAAIPDAEGPQKLLDTPTKAFSGWMPLKDLQVKVPEYELITVDYRVVELAPLPADGIGSDRRFAIEFAFNFISNREVGVDVKAELELLFAEGMEKHPVPVDNRTLTFRAAFVVPQGQKGHLLHVAVLPWQHVLAGLKSAKLKSLVVEPE